MAVLRNDTPTQNMRSVTEASWRCDNEGLVAQRKALKYRGRTIRADQLQRNRRNRFGESQGQLRWLPGNDRSVPRRGGNKRSMRQCLTRACDRQEQHDEQARAQCEKDHYRAPGDGSCTGGTLLLGTSC